MSLSIKPNRHEKLTPGCKVTNFQVHKEEPLLLVSSTQKKLESFYLKYSAHQTSSSKMIPIKTLNTNQPTELFSFAGKHNIVYCSDQNLVINNKAEIKHKEKLNHLLIDEYHVSLTTSADKMTICSIQKAEQLAELQSYEDPISAVYWHNSLAISGDQKGRINLWDINKQKIMHKNSIYRNRIDQIDSFVDYIHTNIYYSLVSAEKRMALHDLRTYRPIKIINNIPSNVKKVKHNQSGKIFLMSDQNVEIIDLYQGFDIMGRFAAVKSQNVQDIMIKHPQAVFQERTLNDMLVEGKFIVVGCSNGCIQVYNTDTFECECAFGLSEYSPIIKVCKVDNAIIGLQAKGILSMILYN